MPNGTYGGVRGRKTKVGRKLSFSSYSIFNIYVTINLLKADIFQYRAKILLQKSYECFRLGAVVQGIFLDF